MNSSDKKNFMNELKDLLNKYDVDLISEGKRAIINKKEVFQNPRICILDNKTGKVYSTK